MNCTCSRRSIVSYLHQEHIMGMWVMLNINGVVGWIAGLVVELGSPGKRSVGLVDRPSTILLCQRTCRDIAAPSAAGRHTLSNWARSVDHLSNITWGFLDAIYRLGAGGGMQWCTYPFVLCRIAINRQYCFHCTCTDLGSRSIDYIRNEHQSQQPTVCGVEVEHEFNLNQSILDIIRQKLQCISWISWMYTMYVNINCCRFTVILTLW